MVKSIICICVASLVLGLTAFTEWWFVHNNFEQFGQELLTLSRKIEEETATEEDARTVQTSWEHRKEQLHVWIPHNDVNRIDDYMAETVNLVAKKEYALATAKIGIMLHMTKCLPDTYRPHIENVF